MRIPYFETQKRIGCLRPEHCIVTGQTMMMSSVNVLRNFRPEEAFAIRRCVRSGNSNAMRVFRRLFGSPEEVPFFEGWPTGFEPATAGTTIRGSTVELRPPCKWGKGK